MQQIYYCYRKDTGEFAGSGTPFIDDETHGCTIEPAPDFDHEAGEMAFWDGEGWRIATPP